MAARQPRQPSPLLPDIDTDDLYEEAANAILQKYSHGSATPEQVSRVFVIRRLRGTVSEAAAGATRAANIERQIAEGLAAALVDAHRAENSGACGTDMVDMVAATATAAHAKSVVASARAESLAELVSLVDERAEMMDHDLKISAYIQKGRAAPAEPAAAPAGRTRDAAPKPRTAARRPRTASRAKDAAPKPRTRRTASANDNRHVNWGPVVELSQAERKAIAESRKGSGATPAKAARSRRSRGKAAAAAPAASTPPKS